MPTEHRYCNHRHDLDLRVLYDMSIHHPGGVIGIHCGSDVYSSLIGHYQ